MITRTNIRQQLLLTAAVATTLALMAGADIAAARGSGGAPSHNSHPSSSMLPEKQGNGTNTRSNGNGTSTRNGTERTERQGTNRNGQQQSQKGCNKRCQTDKTTVVISDANGKVLDRIPGPITSYSAEAVAGGIALHVNGNTYTIAGTQVAVKNEALSTYGALEHGLSQTLVKGPNGTYTTVLTVTKPPLKGL